MQPYEVTFAIISILQIKKLRLSKVKDTAKERGFLNNGKKMRWWSWGSNLKTECSDLLAEKENGQVRNQSNKIHLELHLSFPSPSAPCCA